MPTSYASPRGAWEDFGARALVRFVFDRWAKALLKNVFI